jgi:4-aminobutyrate aminotransferase/(S)-3-amino-2-methylpropionate transaminase
MPYKQGFGPFAPEVHRLPFAYPYRCPTGGTEETCGESCLAYAIDEMNKHIGAENIACVILEPIQGEGGFIVPAPGFVKGLKEYCERSGALFVADEIQSGIGRTGKWFAIEHEDVVPDIVTSAKSLGGGLPISAITGRADVMDSVHAGGLGGTYGGNPIAAAAALAALEQIESESLVERANTVGRIEMQRLRDMEKRYDEIGEIRGRGAMIAMEFVADRTTKEPLDKATGNRIVEECYRNGVVILKAGTYDNVIRLLPPLTIDEPLLEEGLGILDEAIGKALAG